jgi:hypothetical protein
LPFSDSPILIVYFGGIRETKNPQASIIPPEDVEYPLTLVPCYNLAFFNRLTRVGAESKRNSERMRSNMGTAIGKGIHVGRPPYGLRPIKNIKGDSVTIQWELDPVEAPKPRRCIGWQWTITWAIRPLPIS